MKRVTRRIVLAVAVLGLMAGASEQARATFLTNLIVNGNAESGSGSPSGDIVSVPDWTTAGSFTVVEYGAAGGFPTATDPGPTNRGLNFFAGGPSNPLSSAFQSIDESADAAVIDTGKVNFTLSGFLGGWDSQDDHAVLSATFLDNSGSDLGSASIGPVWAADRGDETGLLLRTTTGVLPIGTRTIDVLLTMTRDEGDYNDGYADNLSLVLTPSAVPEPSTLTGAGIAVFLSLACAWRRRKAKHVA